VNDAAEEQQRTNGIADAFDSPPAVQNDSSDAIAASPVPIVPTVCQAMMKEL